MAFAAMLLQLMLVDDLHVAAVAPEHPESFEPPGNKGHRGAADAEHLRERALGQWDFVAGAARLDGKEPTANPRFDRVHRVTQRILLRLRDQPVAVTRHAP